MLNQVAFGLKFKKIYNLIKHLLVNNFLVKFITKILKAKIVY